ncbi:unnamed protein product [Adineta steineri]|nr:unnamed protein product [Adineta steineri]
MDSSYEVAKFDFMLTFIHNLTSDNDLLSCHFICSRDIFDDMTVLLLANRFQHLINHLFSSTSTLTSSIDTCLMPLMKLSLILPEESEEIQHIIFCRQANIVGEGM